MLAETALATGIRRPGSASALTAFGTSARRMGVGIRLLKLLNKFKA
jgi:hypothetical protein